MTSTGVSQLIVIFLGIPHKANKNSELRSPNLTASIAFQEPIPHPMCTKVKRFVNCYRCVAFRHARHCLLDHPNNRMMS